MSIGFKIKKLREQHNLSQPELAEVLDISQAKLSNIENGKNRKEIDIILLDKIRKYFDKDFDYFLEEKTINKVKDNKGQISCTNFTINNQFPNEITEQLLVLTKQMQIILESQSQKK